VSAQEVAEAVFSIKSEAIGLDNVSLKFVKFVLAPSLIPHLTNFFNIFFTHNIFPADWKVSKIILLPKISNPSNFSDYRPIAILPCLLKAFEVCMRSQMVEYLILNKLLDPLQSGFKANHSTRTARLSMISVKLMILNLLLF
jgi:hypothetical protein